MTGPTALKGSIVVIVRNGEDSIGACLESLAGQSRHCEIVVVDGNSTDRTREIVRQFPVKLLLAPKHDSYGISRNVGVQNSTGDVVLFMDADDYCEKNWAELLLKDFESDPRLGIVAVAREPSSLQGWFMKELGYEYGNDERAGEGKEGRRSTDWRDVTTKGSAWLKKAMMEAGGFDGAMFFGT
jgi:glycosyltransferase involved in cell wall biosynthesis